MSTPPVCPRTDRWLRDWCAETGADSPVSERPVGRETGAERPGRNRCEETDAESPVSTGLWETVSRLQPGLSTPLRSPGSPHTPLPALHAPLYLQRACHTPLDPLPIHPSTRSGLSTPLDPLPPHPSTRFPHLPLPRTPLHLHPPLFSTALYSALQALRTSLYLPLSPAQGACSAGGEGAGRGRIRPRGEGAYTTLRHCLPTRSRVCILSVGSGGLGSQGACSTTRLCTPTCRRMTRPPPPSSTSITRYLTTT